MIPSERRPQLQTCSLAVADHLAEYARRRFRLDRRTGAIIIPRNFDLWHCLWHVMQKAPRGGRVAKGGNLLVRLPNRQHKGGMEGKDPAWWNYVSPRGSKLVERQLRRLYYFDFHSWMLDSGRSSQMQCERVRTFMRRWGTSPDHEDALLKEWQRYRKREKSADFL